MSFVGALLMAVWIGGLSLGGVFGARVWMQRTAAAAQHEAVKPKPVLRKLKPVTAPIVRGGEIQGYIVAQFDYLGDEKLLSALPMSPDAVLSDEIFRALYDDDSIDLYRPAKISLDQASARVIQRVRERIKSDAVEGLVVGELSYVLRRDMQ